MSQAQGRFKNLFQGGLKAMEENFLQNTASFSKKLFLYSLKEVRYRTVNMLYNNLLSIYFSA